MCFLRTYHCRIASSRIHFEKITVHEPGDARSEEGRGVICQNRNGGDKDMVDTITAEGVFLNTVAAVLNNKRPSVLPEGIKADDIFTIGSGRNMAPISFCALNMIEPKPASDKWGEYQKRFMDDCMRSEIQLSEYHKLVEYLCGNGVKIIPLKGCVMKELYPSPNFRVMSDVDLLYKGVTAKELATLMEDFGYSTEHLETGNHDVFHKSPCMNIELHRQLMADDSPYKPIFDNIFERAVLDERIPNLYHLTPEDMYIHEIAHAAKHFKNREAHIRHVGDIYVLNQKYAKGWNTDYIRKQLDSVGLLKFEEKIRSLAYTFFGDESIEVSELDMEMFFPENRKLPDRMGWKYMDKGGKSRVMFFLSRTFYPYSGMCRMYPILKKCPILLPFAWIHRIIDVLLHRRENVAKIASVKVNDEDARHVRRLMDNFGLSD